MFDIPIVSITNILSSINSSFIVIINHYDIFGFVVSCTACQNRPSIFHLHFLSFFFLLFLTHVYAFYYVKILRPFKLYRSSWLGSLIWHFFYPFKMYAFTKRLLSKATYTLLVNPNTDAGFSLDEVLILWLAGKNPNSSVTQDHWNYSHYSNF